ncbi:MAG TPA: hypothetical protein VNT76_11930, partial [Candidatus Binatus sp.]|nr:hypothetical protein [Candidatus Binatus sp.]
MAKQQSTDALDLSASARAARGWLGFGADSRLEVTSVVMTIVSIITGYLVLPPLYSVIQTSLFTTTLTGEIDKFTLRYYEDLVRELQVVGPFLNTLYFAVGAALLST